MKKSLSVVAFSILLVTTVIAFAPAPADDAPITVLRAARLLDVRTGVMTQNGQVIVQGERILSAGPKADVPAGATIVDLGDMTLLPGLIDAHVHIDSQLGPNSPMEPVKFTAADKALRGAHYAHVTLMAGFTTVRNMGSGHFVDVSLNNAIEEGFVDGPRIIPCGNPISITGGHGDASGFAPGIVEGDWRDGVADGPDEVVKAVRYQIKHGAKVIKLMATAGVLSYEENVGAQQLSDEELRAAVVEAHRHGMKVAAHAHGTEGIKAAVRAGVDSVEHCSILDDEAIALMKEKGTWMVPTVFLSTLLGDAPLPPLLHKKALYMIPRMQENLKKAVAAGVKIAFGTDAAVYPHGLNAGEFEMYVKAGMTPLQAIQTATINDIALLGVDDRGTLEAGKLADIIAVPGDPLRDITVLKKVGFVMKGGTIYKK